LFFSDWTSVLRVLIVGALTYPALIAILRISGKRTLAKFNAFDLVITVALGSTFATTLLSKDVALIEGVLAFAVLATLQFIVAWGAMHWSAIKSLAKSKPKALLVDGSYQSEALHKERVTPEEVMAAVRGAGYGDLSQIALVVLETDGSLSVIAKTNLGDSSALKDL